VIASNVHEWVVDSGLFGAVLSASDTGAPSWYLDTDVTDLYGDLRDPARPQAVVAVSFAVFRHGGSDDSALLRKSYEAREPMAATGPDALVSAWDVGLSRVLAEFESDLSSALSRTAERSR
jgi:hypothetical protein